MWLCWLGIVPQSKKSPVWFPARAYAWVAGLVPRQGVIRVCTRGNWLMFLPHLSIPSLLSSLKINKIFKKKSKIKSLLNKKLVLPLLLGPPHFFEVTAHWSGHDTIYLGVKCRATVLISVYRSSMIQPETFTGFSTWNYSHILPIPNLLKTPETYLFIKKIF